MSWDQSDFLARVAAAVDAFDRERTAELCAELVDRIEQGEEPQEKLGRKVLAALRRKCYFDLMEQVADTLRSCGFDDNQVRRQYAQALIDQGKLSAAVYVLELLESRTADDPEENAEVRGLLGRVYKQQYVNAARDNPQAKGNPLTLRHLRRAVRIYDEVYRLAPAEHLWHGINTVALVSRARRDRVTLDAEPDAGQVARQILATIEAKEAKQAVSGEMLYAWDMATAMEASVALGDYERAWAWLGRYIENPKADGFELSSTERQLREVWELTVESPPGASLLPVLEAAALKRKFGRVLLPGAQVAETIRQTLRLEQRFSSERWVSFPWYRMGLERFCAVAQIRKKLGGGTGTGFIVRGGDLAPALGDELLLLTNAHVVSDDPAVLRSHPRALPPERVVAAFEALETAGDRTFEVAEALWTSPPEELDATLLRLDRPVTPCRPYPVAERLPQQNGDKKVYVIGHPLGEGLSISLSDNHLLGYDDRLLHYRAPTEGGSSGSPVFDDGWELIGLHHGGGRELRRLDGRPGTYQANEGIQIQRIAAAVQAAKVGG